jgi:hypothetical protein
VPREHFDALIDLSLASMPQLMKAQRDALAAAGVDLDLLGR